MNLFDYETGEQKAPIEEMWENLCNAWEEYYSRLEEKEKEDGR